MKIDSFRYSYLQTLILDFIEDLTYSLPDITTSIFKDAAKYLSKNKRDS
jgi:hypothetical protein